MFDNSGFLQTLPQPFMKAQQMKVIAKLVVLQVATMSNKLWNQRLSRCPSHGPVDLLSSMGGHNSSQTIAL